MSYVSISSVSTYSAAMFYDSAPNTFQITRVGSKALGSVAHRSPFAEACLILSLPSVSSMQKERTEYRTYVIT